MTWLAALLASLTIPVLLIYLREAWIWTGCCGVWLGFSGLASARAFYRGAAVEWDWKTISILTLPSWGALQIAFRWTAAPEATLNEALLWVALATLFVASRYLLDVNDLWRRFLDLSLIVAVSIAILGLVQFCTSNGRIYWAIPTELDHVLGPFRNRNHFAALMELMFPLAFAPAVEKGGRRMEFALISAILAAPALLGGSRAGMAILAAEVVVILGLQRGRKWATAAAAVLAILLPYALPSRGDGNRRDLYAATLEMIAARPWTGHGLGAYESTYPAFAKFDNGLIVDHAHNDWLEWMAEAGLFPVLPLAALVAWTMRQIPRSPWALGIPAIFVHALIDYPLHKPPLAAWTFVMMAALVVSVHERRAKSLPDSVGLTRTEPR